jgi:hypothetical protein
MPPDQFGTKSFLPPGAPTGGQGFNLSVQYTESRSRPVAPLPGSAVLPGISAATQRQAGLNLSFQPTAKWSANWTSQYDFVARQFAAHVISLQRDLHRWHASFSFSKSPNGNFAFSFYVSLLDQPDIKFNYQQQSFAQ